VSPTIERARRKEQAFSQLLSELTPFTDMTVVPSITDLQRRFPGLGKVWATSVHEKLRYARRKRFHEQVADEIIRTVVKRRKGSLLDLDESELADICPDSARLNSRYGGRLKSPGDIGKEDYATSLGEAPAGGEWVFRSAR
jgi:hypothetical protein